jgi:hypothetical protein
MYESPNLRSGRTDRRGRANIRMFLQHGEQSMARKGKRSGRGSRSPQGPARGLCDAEARGRLRPFLPAIARAYAEGRAEGMRDPVVVVARRWPHERFSVSPEDAADALPVASRLIRRAGGDGRPVVILVDGRSWAVVGDVAVDVGRTTRDELVAIVSDRWEAGLSGEYDRLLDPVVFVEVLPVFNEIHTSARERTTMIAWLSAHGGEAVARSRQPAKPGCVPVWLCRPRPWRLEALDVPRHLLDGRPGDGRPPGG